jgi:hypothetical protein
MAVMGRPRAWTSAAELQNAIDAYFMEIDKSEKTITDEKGRTRIIKKPAFWTRLLLHIGMTREGIRPYVNGEYDSESNNFSDVLTRARMLCEADLAENAMTGNYAEKTTGLVLQNYHNYAAKQEIKAELTQDAGLNDQEIEAKLKRLLAKHQNSGA